MSRSGYRPGPGWQRRRLACFRAAAGRCAYCGAETTLAGGQADHVIPISAGGSRGGRLAWSCKPCHAKKSGRERSQAIARRKQAAAAVSPLWKVHAEIGRRLRDPD